MSLRARRRAVLVLFLEWMDGWMDGWIGWGKNYGWRRVFSSSSLRAVMLSFVSSPELTWLYLGGRHGGLTARDRVPAINQASKTVRWRLRHACAQWHANAAWATVSHVTAHVAQENRWK